MVELDDDDDDDDDDHQTENVNNESNTSTLPETNSKKHLKMVVSNRNLLFQGAYFSFREGIL